MNSVSFSVPRVFEGAQLDHVSYPIGGMGAGMFCLDGAGAFSHFSLRHHPDCFSEAMAFSTVAVRDNHQVKARVLEGPIANWKPLFPWNRGQWRSSGHGGGGRGFGLPRFESARFSARFPFATVTLKDKELPLETEIVAWSPFVPGDADNSGLPVGTVEYSFTNSSDAPLEIVYSFHAKNFLASQPLSSTQSVKPTPGGFIVSEEGTTESPWLQTACAMWIDEPEAKSDLAWFRGRWFDSLTVLWKTVAEGLTTEHPA